MQNMLILISLEMSITCNNSEHMKYYPHSDAQ